MGTDGSTSNSTRCFLTLAWTVLLTAACVDHESTGSENPKLDDSTIEFVDSNSTSGNDDAESAGTTMGDQKRSNGCRAPALASGAHYLSLRHGGWNRSFIMTVPESANEQTHAYPLLIAMHGFGGNGEWMRNMLGKDNGFEVGHVVLYPDGAGFTNDRRGWNSGHPQCCGTALHDNVDDVAFLRELVDSAAQDTCIDLNRVHATGFSNGGDMAQRLACDASDLVSAVTSVGGRFDYHATACPGERPVPAVLYRGLLDRTVPYEKSVRSLVAIQTIPAIGGFKQIARNHRCQEDLFDTTSIGNTDCIQIDNCGDEFEITLCTSADSGHCWPGIGSCSPTRARGVERFIAVDHMREFFSRQSMAP